MNRRRFITLAAAECLFNSLASRAQPAGNVVTVGLLLPSNGPTPRFSEGTAILAAGLRELGWIEGKNFRLETRWAGTNPDRQREMAAELKALPVALMIATGTITVRAARDGAPGVPLVMVNAGDPVGSGLVASLSRPGGDLTGTSAAGEEVLGKQLELLSAAVPQLKRISVLMNSANPANGFFFDAMAARAKALGVQLDRIDVTVDSELDAAVARAKGGALVVLGDPMFYANRARITALAIHFKIPSIYGGPDYVVAGGLMSYLSSNEWHWRTAAALVDKILKGTRPADIPVAQPTEFKLVINLKTAKSLGITVPQSLLLRADEKIQ
jgi:putative ABC transport system substrate-binding protein